MGSELIVVFVITLLGILVVNTLNRIIDNVKTIQNQVTVEVKEKCPPHKWEYDHMGVMMCGKCEYRIVENQ